MELIPLAVLSKLPQSVVKLQSAVYDRQIYYYNICFGHTSGKRSEKQTIIDLCGETVI